MNRLPPLSRRACVGLLAALAALAVTLPNAAAAAPPRYRITVLGVLPTHDHSIASAINAAGEVVGASQRYASDSLPGERRGFRWSPQEGLVALPFPAGTSELNPTGISDDGLVVGFYTDDDSYSTRAFYWLASAGLNEIERPAEGSNLTLHAINASGLAVGSDAGIGYDRPIKWRLETGIQALGSKDGAQARAVNESGEAAGWAPFARHPREYRPIRFDQNGKPTSLGSLPRPPGIATDGNAAGINDQGQVVGNSMVGEGKHYHAFLSTPGQPMLDLGALPRERESFATDINNHGQVVGSSGSVQFRQRMFLWTAEHGMLDVNQLIDPLDPLKGIVRLDRANAINDRGQIAGQAGIRGAIRAVLLTPLP